MKTSDEYANCIPNPKHMPKYTKAKVLHTKDKHTQLSCFADLRCCRDYSLNNVDDYFFCSPFRLFPRNLACNNNHTCTKGDNGLTIET